MLRQSGSPAAWRATLGRSVRLFRDFRYEQPDPARFYTALADDSVQMLGRYADLGDRTVLDVGGGPGYFREAFERAGATYVALDADVGELAGVGEIHPRTVIGSGMRLPFRDGAVDVDLLLQRARARARPVADGARDGPGHPPGGSGVHQLHRLVRPLGWSRDRAVALRVGGYARRRYRRRHGHEPKNRFGESLFEVTVADGLRFAREQTDAQVVAVFPRYHPAWAYPLLRVPVVREVLTWNLMIVLRRPDPGRPA